MNEKLTYQVLQAAIDCGVREFIICPGSRNSAFVEALRLEERFLLYYWPEERSAAFFALGRSRLTQRPTAVITTSGTAAAELLPAAMEAYYTGVPLLLLTADRPPRFRGSGAPQSAEQVGLFGQYARFSVDLDGEQAWDLSKWNQRGPAHINVCLEEPQSQPKFVGQQLTVDDRSMPALSFDRQHATSTLDRFFSQIQHPLVIVSTLKAAHREAVAALLLALDAPVVLEGVSGLREDPRLQHLRIKRTDKILESAKLADYAIDGVLRIGGIPTPRIWRDLEYLENDIQVCAISDVPFSGLSWNRRVVCGPVDQILACYLPPRNLTNASAKRWLKGEVWFEKQLLALFAEEPTAEPALFYALSKVVARDSHIYLGNSLPIREWDLAATSESRGLEVTASRGLNGIDGQISTFLGLCQPQRQNWAFLGDLTTLYDMAGFWILPQMEKLNVNIVVINNGGGQIFARLYPYQEMLNEHSLNFGPLAQMWGLQYDRWESIPQTLVAGSSCRLIEVVPDAAATKRLLTKIGQLSQACPAIECELNLR